MSDTLDKLKSYEKPYTIDLSNWGIVSESHYCPHRSTSSCTSDKYIYYCNLIDIDHCAKDLCPKKV